MRRLAVLSAIAGLATLWLQVPAPAQTLLERLVMPGPLVEGHAKLEAQCTKCHEPFSRHSQSNLCLDCHKDIAADRAARTGIHGREREALSAQCRQCHSDHKGRAFDVTQLDRETFNHDLTNYRLVDAHRTVPCAGCHTENVKFRKASSVCFECHKRADPHRGRLGESCENCHSTVKWRDTKPFDHDKTHFALEGAHAKVACAACHAGQVYKDMATSCVSCHRLQDVHADRYGTRCETCHDQTRWANRRFDHDKTKYPLRGAHVRVNCDTCHTGSLYQDKLATTCASCHRKDDPHRGKLGERCETCHGNSDWRKKVSFDHDLTRFPLVGLHAQVPCEECHRSQSYKGEPVACEKCHEDVHQGRLGGRCASCHNPNGWARWRFDHGRQTNFPLTGAHQKLACENCHKTKSPPSLKLASDCYGCHRGKDVHYGSFGRDCQRCHNTAEWRKLELKR